VSGNAKDQDAVMAALNAILTDLRVAADRLDQIIHEGEDANA
jgi:hypothetical protein